MATMTLIGLYNYDNTIFDNMQLPAELDFNTVKNSILLNCSEFEVLYPSPDAMKDAIEFWSKMKLHSWQKIAAALYKDYNPFVNFTRDETRETTYTPNLETTSSATNSNENNFNLDNTKKIAAWNEGAPQTNEINNQSSNSKGNETTNSSSKETGNAKTLEKFHSEGDSALFTPTDVAKKEAELRLTFDMLDIIINDFKVNLVLAIY